MGGLLRYSFWWHSTLSKHARRATCLFAMRSSFSLLNLKIFCWCFSFVDSSAFIWLSRPMMACWCSSCIFPMPFLVSHFTKATVLGFLERTAVSLALFRSMNISWEFFVLPRGSIAPTPSISDLGRDGAMKTPWSYLLYSLCLGTFLGIFLSQTF